MSNHSSISPAEQIPGQGELFRVIIDEAAPDQTPQIIADERLTFSLPAHEIIDTISTARWTRQTQVAKEVAMLLARRRIEPEEANRLLDAAEAKREALKPSRGLRLVQPVSTVQQFIEQPLRERDFKERAAGDN